MTRIDAAGRDPLSDRRLVRTGGDLRLGVRHLFAAVDFYLAVGCEVQLAADEWVRLRQAGTRFDLVKAVDTDEDPLVVNLTSPDLHHLRRRLRALGIDAGPVTCDRDAPRGRIEVRDPDGHRVLIRHLVLAPAPRTGAPVPAGPRTVAETW